MINLLRVETPEAIIPPSEWPHARAGAAPGAQESVPLEFGKPMERELSGAQSHSYKVTMTAGQCLRIVVEQRGIDVAVALFTPDGKKIDEVDSEKVTVMSETISVIAEATGAYKVEARSVEKTAGAGRYQIRIESLKTATAEDKYRVAGETLFREAQRLASGAVEDRRKSLEKYHEALDLYLKARDRDGEAQTLNGMGDVHWSLGELRKALDKYNEALPIFRALGSRRWEGLALIGAGLVYLALGERQKALETHIEALPIIREAGDRKAEAITLNSLGEDYRLLGELQKALDNYNESLPIRRAIGDRSGEARTLNNMALVYSAQGELQKALDKHLEILPIRRAAGDRSGEATTFNNLGSVYQWLGELPKALEKYNESLSIFKTLGNRRGQAVALHNVGAIYYAMSEFQKALDTYSEALKISKETEDRGGQLITLNTLGQTYQLLKEWEKALEKHNEALQISRAIGDRDAEALALLGFGAVYQSREEWEKALEKLNEALSFIREKGSPNIESFILLRIARAEQKRGNLSQARQTIEQAVGIIESMRINIAGQGFRASYFAARREYFEFYMDILMEQGGRNPDSSLDALALAISERARARTLLELLAEARADIRQGVDNSLLERERALRRRFNVSAAARAGLLRRKHTPEQAEAASKEIASITAELEDIESQIRARSPRYAALIQPQPLNLTEIQRQVLDPDTLLLEYSLGTDASYLFTVSQTSITSHKLPKRTEIEAVTRRLRELLTAPQPQPGDTEAKYLARVKEAGESYWAQAAELSRMLLGPVASQLGKKRLAIVADGALQYIPFAALPAPSPGNEEARNSGAEPQPLFVDHEIVSLPSASTLATLRRETADRKPAEKALAVLADPVFADDDTRVSRNVGKAGSKEKARSADSDEKNVGFLQMMRSGRETGLIDAEGGFGRLLSTRREAAAISALVPERERMQALDFEANRTTALRPELGEYRIVHFATHGILNNTHPELSGIVLSLVDKEGKPQDGFLRLQDIYNLKLPAELVVLSACQTGLGKEIKGEGVIGVTRGFMYAGAPRIVASLWKVDDRATSELMKRFYQGLLGPERLSAAGALRQAQLSIWKQKQWRAPYYWAAFVLQGEWK